MNPFIISGFADEICDDFEQQLKVVKSLGMSHICIRSAYGKNICDYTPDEAKNELLPLLNKYNIKVSSIGSPLGKVFINDDAAINAQIESARKTAETANILSCNYVRVFSFYIPENDSPEVWRDKVMEKVSVINNIFAQHNVICLHENEKDIYGDTADRCVDLIKTINSKNFKGIFDFANFLQCNEDVMLCYDKLKEYIDYFHIKDYDAESDMNVLCGTGQGKIYEILKIAFDRGFKGFLTMEPHLVLFGTLKMLELEDASDIIKKNLYKDGADGFSAQHKAITDIVSNIIS